MAKNNRGRALWKKPSRGRGTCPVCNRTRIKLLYTALNSNGQKLTVCKNCQNASKEKLDQVVV